MSRVSLKVEPKTPPVKWKKFIQNYPPRSIALDGFVFGPPRHISKDGRDYASLNHHELVNRYATRATCGQVLMSIRMGMLEEMFRDDRGNLDFTVYANDCDEDVCLSWFLLRHSEMARNPINPQINRLVHLEDLMDATAGAYPFPIEGAALAEIGWIFHPYHLIRLNNGLGRRSAEEFRAVIEDVEHRIMDYITGKGKTVELDTRYKIINQYGNFVIMEEIGAQCRTKMYSDGIRSFLAVKKRPDGVYDYKIGKMSPYIKMDLIGAMKTLNDLEGLSDNPDQWGGGDTIGGSPRIGGSRLKPEQIAEVVLQKEAEAEAA